MYGNLTFVLGVATRMAIKSQGSWMVKSGKKAGKRKKTELFAANCEKISPKYFR